MRQLLMISIFLFTLILLPSQVLANLNTYLLESDLTQQSISSDVHKIKKTVTSKSKSKFKAIKKLKDDDEDVKTQLMVRSTETKVFFYSHAYDLILPSSLIIFDLKNNELYWNDLKVGTISENQIVFSIKYEIDDYYYDTSLSLSKIENSNSYKLEEQIKQDHVTIYKSGIFNNFTEIPVELTSKEKTNLNLDEQLLERLNNKFYTGRSLYTDYDGTLYTAHDTLGFVNLDKYFIVYDYNDSFFLFADYLINVFYKYDDRMSLLTNWVSVDATTKDEYLHIDYYNPDYYTHTIKINLRINKIDRLLFNSKAIHNDSNTYEMVTGNLPPIK